MTVDKAKQIIQNFLNWNMDDQRLDNAEMEELVKVLDNVLENEKDNRWIPCSKRLPEESLNSVIGWDEYRKRCVFVQYVQGKFQNMGTDDSFNITAWQPVPEPYKEESEKSGRARIQGTNSGRKRKRHCIKITERTTKVNRQRICRKRYSCTSATKQR